MGNYTLGIFIDLAKAFDFLNRSLLLKKLEHYGIRSFSLRWFSNYFSARKQYVVYGNASCPMLSVEYGLPQGSMIALIC